MTRTEEDPYYLRLAVSGVTFDPERESGPLSATEVLLNDIAASVKRIAALVPEQPPTVAQPNPYAMLAGLMREVWRLARTPMIHGFEVDQITLTDVADSIGWLDRMLGDGIEFTSSDWSGIEGTGIVYLQGKDHEDRMVDVTVLIDEVYVQPPEPEFETYDEEG